MDEALDLHLSLGIPMRTGNRNPRLAPWNVYPAADGHLAICVATNEQWMTFSGSHRARGSKGRPAFFKNQEGRFKHSDEVEIVVKEWLQGLTKEGALRTLRAKKVPCDPVPETPEVLEDPQLKFRGVMPELLTPIAARPALRQPASPFIFPNFPGDFEPRSIHRSA